MLKFLTFLFGFPEKNRQRILYEIENRKRRKKLLESEQQQKRYHDFMEHLEEMSRIVQKSKQSENDIY